LSILVQETRSRPSREQFRGAVAKGLPLMIRGGVADWKAIGKWSPEYIERTVGDRRVPVEFYPTGGYYESWLTFETKVKRYLELIRANNQQEKYYMAEVRIDEILPELWADVAMPDFLERERHLFTAFFFGLDTISGLHYHATDQAMLSQVFGRKKVTLYPPGDFENLYFHPWFNHRFNFSRISFDRVESTRFPRLSQASGVSCELEPGDALFIPIHWGHLVEGYSWNASITFFWRPRLREWKLHRTAVHARVGRSFRTLVSRPLAKLCDRVFGFRVIR
jgi:hypothetical protein